jgi:hypothetical protein
MAVTGFGAMAVTKPHNYNIIRFGAMDVTCSKKWPSDNVGGRLLQGRLVLPAPQLQALCQRPRRETACCRPPPPPPIWHRFQKPYDNTWFSPAVPKPLETHTVLDEPWGSVARVGRRNPHHSSWTRGGCSETHPCDKTYVGRVGRPAKADPSKVWNRQDSSNGTSNRSLGVCCTPDPLRPQHPPSPPRPQGRDFPGACTENAGQLARARRRGVRPRGSGGGNAPRIWC